MCQNHWSAKYRSRSLGQGTCRVSTLRRSIKQGLVVVCLIVEEVWNVNIKCVKSHWSVEYRLRLPGQGTYSAYIEEKHYTRFGGCRPYS